MFHLLRSNLNALRYRRKLRHVPRHLSPHLMLDIGLEPWPEEEPKEPFGLYHF